MPFALHTMDPGCPVVAIEETAEAAWEAADRMGLPRAKALVLPCAFTLPGAVAAAEELNDAQVELAVAVEQKKEIAAEVMHAERDARGWRDEADKADAIIHKVTTHLKKAEKTLEKLAVSSTARESYAVGAIRDALTLAKGGDLDSVKGAA